jgi:MATE family multidrug resistance protein
VFMILGLGAMTALSPLVAHAYGAGRNELVGAYAGQGAWIAAVLAVLLVAGLWLVRPVLLWVGTDAAVVPAAVGYVYAISAGIPGMLGYHALRAISEGLGRTRPMMVVGVLALATNVAGNWVFMYGKFGFPALGAVGTGVATAIVQWVMFGLMLLHVARHPAYRPYRILARPGPPERTRLLEILRLGLPIGGSMIAECALFSAAALMVSTLGATIVGAHQIALNWASFMFMAPVSIHSATTIHVGHALGRGDRAAARRAGFTGIGLCGVLMLGSALVLSVASDGIAALYTADPAVRSVAAQLLLLAGVFQVSDGLQVGAMGALRGFKDAHAPLAITIGSYWAIGFPLALYGGIVRGGGPVGVWWGLIAGLSASALLLNLRFARLSRAATAG